jgi:hypothetical protein
LALHPIEKEGTSESPKSELGFMLDKRITGVKADEVGIE